MEVRLYLHIKKSNGKRSFAPVAYGKNSKILPQRALVGGQVELHPEGQYTSVTAWMGNRFSGLLVRMPRSQL